MLEKLLEGAEVEWKPLGDKHFFKIANSDRRPVKASLRFFGKTPYYGANNIQDYVDGNTHDGEYVLIAEDGSKNIENYSIQYVKEKFWANNHVHVVCGTSRVNTRFLYHYLCIINFIPFLTGGERAKLTKGQMIQISIPIPCPEDPSRSLAIQQEIVRILDTFTALKDALKAELTARKKQYNCYRDQLLNFSDDVDVEWKPLGDVLVRTKGTKITAGQMKELHKDGAPLKIFAGGRNVAFFDFEDIPLKDINKEPSIIVKSRGVIEFEYYDKPFSHKNEMWSYHSKNNGISIKYVYYYLQLNEFHFQNLGSKMQMPQIAIPDTDKLKIPIPSLKEQARIVGILDKFDALTHSLSEGLPREIALRQKQYAYYRAKIFNSLKQKTKEI